MLVGGPIPASMHDGSADRGALVKGYLLGAGSVAPALFWVTVTLYWGLGETILVLVRAVVLCLRTPAGRVPSE